MSTPGRTSATRNFLTLASGEVLAAGVAFFTTIYVARTLGVTAYGVIGFAAAILIYLTALVDGGVEAFGPREVAAQRARLVALAPSVLAVRFASAVVLATSVAAMAPVLLPAPEARVLTVYGLALFGAAASTRWVHLGLEQPGVVAVARISWEVVKLLVVLTLVRAPTDLLGVPLAECAGAAASATFAALALRRHGVVLDWHLDVAAARELLRQARPLMWTILLGLAIYNLDSVFLRIFRDRPEVGLYVAAYTFINALGLLGKTVRLTLLPSLTRLETAGARHDFYRVAMARVFALGLPIAVVGCVLAPQIVAMAFGSTYAAAARPLQVLIWSIPLLLLRSVLQSVLVAVGLQERVLRITAWTAALSVALNLALVPILGAVGAATQTLIAEVARTLLALRWVRAQGFPIAGIDRFWRSGVAAAVMGAVLIALGSTSLWLGLVAGAIGYAVALTLTGGLRFRGAMPLLRV